jgi:hypothetical protein
VCRVTCNSCATVNYVLQITVASAPRLQQLNGDVSTLKRLFSCVKRGKNDPSEGWVLTAANNCCNYLLQWTHLTVAVAHPPIGVCCNS